VPPDELEAILEPFVQPGRSLNGPHEGTGSGLAISRDLARDGRRPHRGERAARSRASSSPPTSPPACPAVPDLPAGEFEALARRMADLELEVRDRRTRPRAASAAHDRSRR
jgi:hypothetical protein